MNSRLATLILILLATGGILSPAIIEPPATAASLPTPIAQPTATASPTATPEASPTPAVDYYPTERMVLFAVSPTEAVEVPIEFARLSLSLIYCESRWNTNAVGRAGELGWLQIHPIHFPRMWSFGLDPQSEAARVWYAGNVIWQESGGAAWSCRP